MAEERRCQEAIRCSNNCGFFGSPMTLNLCSRCYRDHLKSEQDLMAVEKSILGSSSSSPAAAISAPELPTKISGEPLAAEGPMRCTMCRKRVGLTVFPCRCGWVFCGAHRYPEQHECCFDFKVAGREAISRSNPVVRRDKLDKI